MNDKGGAVIAALLTLLMVTFTINTVVVGGWWLIATPFTAFFAAVGVYGLVTSLKKGGTEDESI